MASFLATSGSTARPVGNSLLALRWPVVLAVALLMPLALPVPGSPVALAGFLLLVGGAAMVFSVRWLLVFLPILAALGPYFLERDIGGVNLFGFRLLILILAIFATPLTARSEWWFNPVARASVLFMLLWAFWGMASLLWTPDFAGGKTDVMTIVFGLALILGLLALRSDAPDRLDMLRFGWVAAFIVVAGQAVWEMATGNRLESFMTERHPTYLDSSVVQATLGTPTAFGGFLLLVTPFLLWSFEQSRGAARLLYAALIGAAVVLIFYSGSRLSSVGLAAQLGLYFIILERRWYVKSAAIVAAGAALFIGPKILVDSDLKLVQKWNMATESDFADGSISDRLALTANGLYMLYETGGRGVGAAGFEKRIGEGDPLIQRAARKRGESNAHNFWIEMLSEYGLIPFVSMMALFAWMARLAWQASSRATRGSDVGAAGRGVLAGFIGYIFYGATSGSIMAASIHWMFFATLVVLAAYLHRQQRVRRRTPMAAQPRKQPEMAMPTSDVRRL